ncbi:MAG: M20/M25/M40 family metallo-hydrolase, partial [Nitrospinota bacterium]
MRAETLVAFAQQLIKTESLSGREGEVARLVQQQMHALGYDEVLIDAYGSVIGVIRGQGEKTILFDAHMDTVPVPNPDEWHFPPFGAESVSDRIYGRGSADMKGALAAMVMAAGALAREKHRLAGNIVVTATTWEEFFEGYTLGKALDLLKTRSLYPSAVVIGEATHLAIARGQRGRGEVLLKTYGKPAHASQPQLGIHAVEKILPLLQHILSLHPPQDPFLGEGILVLTDIISSPYPGASV